MVPTLMPGDTILAEMGVGAQVGDIAIALPPTARSVDPSAAPSTAPDLLLVKRVSEIFYDGGVYVISDNTEEPGVRDSRHFGIIPAHHILGRVTSRLAPD